MLQGEQDAGYHEVKFNGAGLSSGVCFCRLQAREYVAAKKLLLVRWSLALNHDRNGPGQRSPGFSFWPLGGK